MTFNDCKAWREYVAGAVPAGIVTVSPLRGREHLKDEGVIRGSSSGHLLSSARGITSRDRNDVLRCDALLVNFVGATEPSIGTMIELGWASAARTPIIISMEDGNPNDHPIVRELADFLVPTLDEAILIASSVVLP
jgi:nucleoside 2-deoxyribosyltransferase